MSLVLSMNGNLIDNSVNRTAFTLSGGIIPGDRGYLLNGTSGYLRHAVANWRSADTKGTFMAWVRRTATGAEARTIFATVDEGANLNKFLISIASQSFWITSNSSTGVNTQVYVDEALAATQWYHLALTSDSTIFKAYINGAPKALAVNTGSNTGQWFSAITLRDSVAIGVDLSNAGAAAYFNGDIDDVQVYNTEFSAPEILDAYETERGQY